MYIVCGGYYKNIIKYFFKLLNCKRPRLQTGTIILLLLKLTVNQKVDCLQISSTCLHGCHNINNYYCCDVQSVLLRISQ